MAAESVGGSALPISAEESYDTMEDKTKERAPPSSAEDHDDAIRLTGDAEAASHQDMPTTTNPIESAAANNSMLEQSTCQILSNEEDRSNTNKDLYNMVIAKIARRIEKNEFPYVISGEILSTPHIQDYDWLEEFMVQTDYVELQCFVNDRYEKHVQDNPKDDAIPNNVRKAQWAYHELYWSAREFYLTKAVNGGDWVRLSQNEQLPRLKTLRSLTLEEHSQIPKTHIKSMAEEHVRHVNDKLMQKWLHTTAQEACSTKDESTPSKLLENFLSTDYFKTLVAALQTMYEYNLASTTSFVPKYCITDDNPDEETLGIRRRIVSNCFEEDAQTAEKYIEESWERKTAEMPRYIRNRLPKDAYATYHRSVYFNVLDQIGSRRKIISETRESINEKLLLPYHFDATPEVLASRQQLLAVLSPQDIDTFNEVMQGQWEIEVNETDPTVRGHLPTRAPEDYLTEKYYPTMYHFFKDKLQHGDQSADKCPTYNTISPTLPNEIDQKHIQVLSSVPIVPHQSKQSFSESAGAHTNTRNTHYNFSSGQQNNSINQSAGDTTTLPNNQPTVGMADFITRGLYQEEPPPVSTHEPVWISAADLLLKTCEGTAWKFEGVVVDFSEPRSYQPKLPQKRKNVQNAEKHVMEVMLTDSSGPITLCLWEEAVQNFQILLQNTDGRHSFYLMIENFRVTHVPTNNYNGHVLTAMKSLHSVQQNAGQQATKLDIHTYPVSPTFEQKSYQPPIGAACISHFLSLQEQLVPPFRATLRGSLQDIRPSGYTIQGQPKTMFSLVDEAGTWIQCCGTGRNAQAKALQNDNEVILYYAAGKEGSETGDGLIWLWRESFIVFIGKKHVPKRVQLKLK